MTLAFISSASNLAT